MKDMVVVQDREKPDCENPQKVSRGHFVLAKM